MIKVVKELKLEDVEMRAVFSKTLDRLINEDPRIVYLDCDLMNSIGMTKFAKDYPNSSFNCGIQEANMIGVAAGMSSVGLIPYVHTFGTFATRRVLDQVFIAGAYSKLNIRILGSDPGVTASYNGGTHMALEDIGIMRGIPEVTVIEPVDSVMLEDAIIKTKDLNGVFYIRLARKYAEKIYENGSTFEIGRAVELRKGTDVTIVASGICVAESLRAASLLENEGISTKIVNIFTIKPIDRWAIVKSAEETGCIVTAENHNVINGLGSAVAEVLSENCPVPLERVGIKDLFGEVGTESYLKKRFKITADDIALAAKKAISRKDKAVCA